MGFKSEFSTEEKIEAVKLVTEAFKKSNSPSEGITDY